jgi:acetylornithine/succinyldiaminopimelate/putrescine aminotransferase
MYGVDLTVDGAAYVKSALRRGLVINCTHDHILRLLPPFIIRAQHVKEFLERFETVLARTPKPKAKPAAEMPATEAVAEPALAAAR